MIGNLPLALLIAVGPIGSQLTSVDSSNLPALPDEFIVEASSEDAAAAGLTVVGEVGFGWTLVSEPVTVDVPSDEIAAEMTTVVGLDVEPNYLYQLAEEPLFPDQWSLDNTGQAGGKVGADIDIVSAWEITNGDPNVVIAVLDTGAALAHSDLSSRLWVNSDEVAGNGLDDDGNGYVDDVNGWDALGSDADPNDTHVDGHGTFVSSIAVAAVNGVGMAGAAPGAVVMPIRVCDAQCPLSVILTGLAYAIDNGADVINLSFGSAGSGSPAFETAIRVAVESGIIVVAAAGNDALSNDLDPFYPASFEIDGLISVAASNRHDSLASFSNFGASSVDLAAPGEDLVGGALPDGWSVWSGTSFSAPLVAGVAALIRSARPDLAPEDVVELLMASVEVLPALSGSVASGGRLNAGAAMDLATTPVALAAASPTTGILPYTVHLSGAESFDPFGEIVNWSWKLPNGSVVAASEAAWSPIKPGTYSATLTVVDNDGLTDSAAVEFSASLRPGGTFVDDQGHFAEGATEAIAVEGITNGCNPPANTRYCPEDYVTRGQMAVFLARAFGVVGGAGDNLFIDDDGSVFESAIDKIAAAGISRGCNPPTNDRYCPDSPVKRGEMAVFLTRALGLTPFYPPPAN